jgi:hypothetical protein
VSLPDYVDYGSLSTVPGPLRCLGATEWGFSLEADHDKLDALCRRVFAETTGGALDLRPLGRHVLLTLGRIDRLVSDVPGFSEMGYSPESQVDIWIPVARVAQRGGQMLAEELLMFMPYIWIDNPISLPSGREMYGYPKAFGWALLPEPGADETSLGLDVFGMDYHRDEAPSRRPLIRVERGERVHELADAALTGLIDLGRHLRHVVEGKPENSKLTLTFAADLFRDIRAGGLRQVYLRQIRAIEDGRKAALQQVTEAPYRILRMRGAPLEHEYAVTITPLDSHPLTAELGLTSQTTRWGFRTESDFALEAGRVLWDSSVA